jgi:hypothetical protein
LQRRRDGHAYDLGGHIQALDPGSGIVTDPERTANVNKREGCNLVVELGRHGRDKDAADTK